MNGSDAQSLLDLLGRRPSDIELDRASLELARIEDPELDSNRWIAEIDDLAARVADRADDLSSGLSFIEATNRVLFEELRFRGNYADYYNPANCCLNRVLESRLGVPITLSVIYLEIARRLAKPVTGIGLPGHFIVRYDDGELATFIDPFYGGTMLDESGCQQLAQVEVLTAEMLAPVDKRHVAMRIVNNLRQVYFSQGDTGKALRVLDLLIAADPASPDEHKQRAVALVQEKRGAEALSGFRRYLELAPDAPDREQIEEHMRDISQWIASRN